MTGSFSMSSTTSHTSSSMARRSMNTIESERTVSDIELQISSSKSTDDESDCSFEERDLEEVITKPLVPNDPKKQPAVSGSDESSSDVASGWSIDTKSTGFRVVLLALLAIQTAAAIVVARYTRSSKPQEDLYESSHLVLVIEMSKFVFSCCLEFYTTGGMLFQSINTHVLQRPLDALKSAVPAIIYVFQNTLLYIALTHLSAPLFLSAYQGKIVSTAIVSVIMLGRRYNLRQWICLVVLTIGVTVVILDEQHHKKQESEASEAAAEAASEDETQGADEGDDSVSTMQEQSLLLGLMAIAGCCFSSAFAGVYIEKVMKKDSDGNQSAPAPSLWMRNIQLAFFSIVSGSLRIAFDDMGKAPEDRKSLLHGFYGAVWLVVFLQAAGGMLVAAVLKYADNVLKSLAMAMAVLLVSVTSVLWLHTPISGVFVAGASAVVTSVYLFSNPVPAACSKPPTQQQLQKLFGHFSYRETFLVALLLCSLVALGTVHLSSV